MHLFAGTRLSGLVQSASGRDLLTLVMWTVVALATIGTEANAQQAFENRPLAVRGAPALVPPIISGASAIALNDSGESLILANGALLRSSPSGIVVIAAPEDPAPGGGTFQLIFAASLNAAGDVAFTALLRSAASPGTFSSGLFRFSEGRVDAVLLNGSSAPDGRVFTNFGRPSMNVSGDIAFVASATFLDGSLPTVTAIYLLSAGSVQELVRADAAAPNGGTFRRFFTVQLNDVGQLLFASGFDVEYPLRLYVHTNNQITPIPGPLAADPGLDGSRDVASLNNLGDVAFLSTDDAAIYLWSGGTTTRVISGSDKALGPSEWNPLHFVGSMSINDARQISFSIVSAGVSGVYVWEGGAVTRIVRTGDSLDSSTIVSVGRSYLNTHGQLAFAATLADSLSTVYVASSGGILRVAGPGDALNVAARFVRATTAGVSGWGDGVFIGDTFPGGRSVFDASGNVRFTEGTWVPGAGFTFGISEVYRGGSETFAVGVLLRDNNRSALVLVRGREISHVVSQDQQAPEGGRFGSLGRAAVNALGDVAFVASVDGRRGLYLARHGVVTPIVRPGEPEPGGGTFGAVHSIALNDRGELAFVAEDTGLSRYRLWIWNDGRLTEQVRTGPAAPGGGIELVGINNFGDVAFYSGLSGGASGLLVSRDGAMYTVAQSGQPIADVGKLKFPIGGSLNDAGDVVFEAEVLNDLGQTTSTAVFIGTRGGLELVAMEPSASPSFQGPRLAGPVWATSGEILYGRSDPGAGGPAGSDVFIARRSTPRLESRDIGDVGPAGWSQVDGETVTVHGNGADIWGTSDAFHWRYTAVIGDFDVVALVTNVEHVNDWTKAGLMIRQDLSPGSAHMFLFATPTSTNGVAFQRRLAPGTATLHTWGPAIAAPVYLKLSRRGHAVSAWFRRSPSENWTFIGIDFTRSLSEIVFVGQAVTSHQYGIGATATFQDVSVTAPGPVESSDVGHTGATGSADTAENLTTIRGSGADIWGTVDAFNWVPTAVTGDFDVVVQVASVEHVHEWTKAGLMIRADSNPAGAHTSVFSTSSNGVAFQRRLVPAGVSTHTAGAASAGPVWLKLSRRGNTVSAYYRGRVTDPWTLIDADSTAAFGATVLVGLGVTSHAEGTLATALFTDFNIAAADVFSSADIGARAGGWTETNGVLTRLGSVGADIWGSTDAFRYHATAWSGDGTITARVLSLDAADPWAKAGVMFRQSLDADSPHVMLLFSAQRGVSVQYRRGVAETSDQAANVSGTAPGWIRLTRSGDHFFGELSRDGVSWRPIGAVSVPLGEHVYVGLALTSHSESAVAYASFDGVVVRPRVPSSVTAEYLDSPTSVNFQPWAISNVPVVIGTGGGQQSERVVRWTAQEGFQQLFDQGGLGGGDYRAAVPTDANERGDVIGFWSRCHTGDCGRQFGFRWTHDRGFEDLGDTLPTGIRADGMMVARCGAPANIACVLSDEAVRALPLPGGATSAFAADLNDAGEVAGSATVGTAPTGALITSAILWRVNGDYLDLGPGGAVVVTNNGMIGINRRIDTNQNRAAVWWDGGGLELPLDASSSIAAINTDGWVVGNLFADGRTRAFAWSPRTNEVVMLGETFSLARGINDHGDIVGHDAGRAVIWHLRPDQPK